MTAEIIDCRNLACGSIIDLETKSRHYMIECLGGNIVRISGHPEYCPTPTEAKLEGSIDSDGMLDVGLIERGRRLMVKLEKVGPLTTSTVVRVHVDAAA